MSDLIEQLEALSAGDRYPFHMPGHKRQMTGLGNPYIYDITEIAGFDDLAEPNGLLCEMLSSLKKIYRAKDIYLSLNGSTGSNLMGIYASICRRDEVIVASNCHRSVPHALKIREANVHLIDPEPLSEGFGGKIRPETVEVAFECYPNAKLVILTSPTYEGIVSDIGKIAEIVHKKNAVLFVDGAHGAHFPFSNIFPEMATELGADAMSISLHKTLPMPGQSSVLVIPDGSRIKKEALEEAWQIFMSSSPSYLLMAMIENGLRWLSSEGESAFKAYENRLKDFYEKTASLKAMQVLRRPDMDPGKLVVVPKALGMDGYALGDLLLERYAIDVEHCEASHVIAMSSVMDTDEGFDRLCDALFDIEKNQGW